MKSPVTSFANEIVTISWAMNDDGGSDVTGYTVLIQKSDGSFD
jgi:hypothetical protein